MPPAGRAMAQAIADQLAACKKENGDTQKRLRACSWIIDEAKDNEDIRIEAQLQRGVLYERAGDKEAAIKDYSQAIALDPTNALAYFNRGNVYDQQGEHDRAIADYTQAIKLDATDPDVFNNRGQVYDGKGEYALAIADYSESIRLKRDWRAPSSTAAAPTISWASTIAPSPTTRRRSSPTPAILMCSTAAAAYDTRVTTIGRLPTTPVDTPQPRQPARLLQPRRGHPNKDEHERAVADYNEATEAPPARCRCIFGPRRSTKSWQPKLATRDHRKAPRSCRHEDAREVLARLGN
jgi:tetratricopeptide (TPR) repeat protein